MKWVTPVRVLVVIVALAAASLLVASVGGTRLGWWPFRTGFNVMRWAGYTGIAAVALAIIAVSIPQVRRRGAGALAAAFVVAAVVAYLPWQWQQRGQSVPRMHDVTTDMDDPPQFVAVVPLRASAGAENPPGYAGKEVAELQRKNYGDIQPLMLDVPPQAAFARAKQAAEAMGWAIVATDAAAGRIEATDTTFWYGFKDDVVIRVKAAGAGSKVDVRSKSRVGRSDFGVNAKRVRDYLTKLRTTL